MSGTVTLHRVLTASPEKVYRAFVEPDAVAKFLPPNGFTCTVHSLEPAIGGTFRMSFRNFTTGDVHTFGGTFTEMVPGERLAYRESFDDPNLAGEMLTTITLKKVPVGTDVTVVQQGIPDPIPVDACYLGWQETLGNLVLLVEPDITG